METNDILRILNQEYNLNINNVELFREGGNLAYVIFDKNERFFLKVIRPPFIQNALHSIAITINDEPIAKAVS